ncbi:hypothetical protein EVAR_93525_1 [Eumeta japonica]|uniref:Uncharacterized protein n=1 Tax=Eumeta variegata TaxID=151549 RepID=A0A4C2A9B8_EUMVA|nr:hypothetical protein EVAR_93525_1 [Eumeta japonica]
MCGQCQTSRDALCLRLLFRLNTPVAAKLEVHGTSSGRTTCPRRPRCSSPLLRNPKLVAPSPPGRCA